MVIFLSSRPKQFVYSQYAQIYSHIALYMSVSLKLYWYQQSFSDLGKTFTTSVTLEGTQVTGP